MIERNLTSKAAGTLLFLLSVLCCTPARAQESIDRKSIEKYAVISNYLQDAAASGASTGDLVIVAAKGMLGSRYVAGTLEGKQSPDGSYPEHFHMSLVETDCILCVESCLAMALNAKKGIYHPDSLCSTVRQLRYRNGTVDGYASRIHYTSEWIRQGEARGLFREITAELRGAERSGQQFHFMSTHPDSYRQLKGNPRETARIRAVEENLNRFEYHYIPKADIAGMLDQLRDGDIVGFNSTVSGLDIAHVGMVYRNGGTVTFIHASMTRGKVVIEGRSIADYIRNIKGNNGIRIIRPLD